MSHHVASRKQWKSDYQSCVFFHKSQKLNTDCIWLNTTKVAYFILSNLFPYSQLYWPSREVVARGDGTTAGRGRSHYKAQINVLSGPCVSPLIRDGGNRTSTGLDWARSVAPAEQDCEKTCQSKPLRARRPHKVCLHTLTNEERAVPHHLPDAVRPLQTAHQLTWLMRSALTAADRCHDKQKQHWPTVLSVCVDLWLSEASGASADLLCVSLSVLSFWQEAHSAQEVGMWEEKRVVLVSSVCNTRQWSEWRKLYSYKYCNFYSHDRPWILQYLHSFCKINFYFRFVSFYMWMHEIKSRIWFMIFFCQTPCSFKYIYIYIYIKILFQIFSFLC